MKTRTLVSIILWLAFYAATATFGQMPAPPPTTLPTGQAQQAQKAFSLTVNKGRYCVGEATRYAITGISELAGKGIVWSSSYAPFSPEAKPTKVNEGSYGQTLSNRDGFSFWSGVGSVWTFAHQGRWTKTATIAGAGSDTAEFIVDICSSSDLQVIMRLSPESGTTLFYRLGTNSTQDIVVLFEGLVDPTVIRGWRVVVDNDNATREVSGLRDGGVGEIFEVNDRQANLLLPSGVAIRIPYPTRYLTPGSHEFRVFVQLANGSELEASAFYNIRPAFETVGQYPLLLPDSPLSCSPSEGTALTNQFYWLYARGGNGSYTWSAPGSEVQSPNRYQFPVSYSTPGVRNVMVFSGGQSAACTMNIIPAPPSTPQPTPRP